jgi:hypothetical protein
MSLDGTWRSGDSLVSFVDFLLICTNSMAISASRRAVRGCVSLLRHCNVSVAHSVIDRVVAAAAWRPCVGVGAASPARGGGWHHPLTSVALTPRRRWWRRRMSCVTMGGIPRRWRCTSRRWHVVDRRLATPMSTRCRVW